MNKPQILGFLQLIATKAPSDQPRTRWVVSHCPFGFWKHDNGKSHPTAFGIRIEPGDSFCSCFSCGWHGNQSDILIELGHLNKQQPSGQAFQLGAALEAVTKAEEEGFDLALDGPDIEQVLFGPKPRPAAFPEDWLQSFPEAWATAMGRDYLQRRGVPEEISHALGLRLDPNQKRLCVPVRDFGGVLRGLHGRAIEAGTEPRYRMYAHDGANNPLIWLGEHWVDLERPIVVVEGPFDLFSVMRVYRNVVSPLFANPSSEKLKRMADAQEWVTLLDNGGGGDAGRKHISQVMNKNSLTHLRPPQGKDPGDMALHELVELLEPWLALDEILVA